MFRSMFILLAVCLLAGNGVAKLPQASKGKKPSDPPLPTSHTTRKIEGWNVRIDDRLLQAPNDEIGKKAIRFLENKLADIIVVVPRDRVKKLQLVTIVLDLSHGKLTAMQYHPSAGWLKANGYSTDLASQSRRVLSARRCREADAITLPSGEKANG